MADPDGAGVAEALVLVAGLLLCVLELEEEEQAETDRASAAATGRAAMVIFFMRGTLTTKAETTPDLAPNWVKPVAVLSDHQR